VLAGYFLIKNQGEIKMRKWKRKFKKIKLKNYMEIEGN
jgi:hypothetical protein